MKKVLRSPLFIIFVTISSFTISIFYFQLNRNYEKSEVEIKKYISNWKYELAENLHKSKDIAFAKKIANGLLEYSAQSYEMFIDGKIVLSSEKINESGDCRSVEKSLFLPGRVRVGKLRVCISQAKVIEDTIFSPTLTFLVMVVLSLLIASAFLPLLGYRKSLNQTIEALKKWGKNPKEMDLELNTKDPITNEIFLLVSHGVRTKTELVNVLSELSAEKEISRLIGQAAHDIKGPVESALKRLRLSPGIPKDEAQGVKKSLDRVVKIAEDLSKTSFSINKPNFYDISSILEQAIEEQRVVHPSIKFKLNSTSEIKAFCFAPVLLRVFSNIINNSIDSFSGKSGLIEVNCLEKDGRCVVSIADNGKGIPLHNQDMVFAENFTSGKKHGTGLGLYYCKKKISEWNGEISLKSQEGRGTTVTIELRTPFKPKVYKSEVV